MTNKMNINNLRTFVEALNKLPNTVKNNEVDITYTNKPVGAGVGCHVGLISIVADYIPELKSLCEQDIDECDYFTWADALAEFLGFKGEVIFDGELNLSKWAENNPAIWDNEYGDRMFYNGLAFGQKTNIFKRSVIIDHWTAVLRRVEQSNKTGEI